MRRNISDFRSERNIRGPGDQPAIYQIEGQPESVLRPGDVFFEPEGERIARFDATGEGVTFLGYFLLSPGQDASITMPDQ